MTEENTGLAELADFTAPVPHTCEMITTPAGRTRCAVWPLTEGEDGRGTIVLAHGLSEHIEKYHDVVAELRKRHFAVAMLDWPGHGRSDPCPAARKEDFHVYDQAFASFMEQKVLDALPAPYIAMGHSMGGCLACCAVHDHPEWFSACMLCSPMLGVEATKKATFLPYVGKGIAMMPESVRRKVNEKKRFDGRFTSDRAKYTRHQELVKANGHLLPRYDFVHWFNGMNDRFAKMRADGWYASIKTPTLLLLAGADTLVDNSAAVSAASLMEAVEMHILDDAWHELLMEKDIIQLPLWAHIDEFLAKHAPSAAQQQAQGQPAGAGGPPSPPPPPDKLVM